MIFSWNLFKLNSKANKHNNHWLLQLLPKWKYKSTKWTKSNNLISSNLSKEKNYSKISQLCKSWFQTNQYKITNQRIFTTSQYPFIKWYSILSCIKCTVMVKKYSKSLLNNTCELSLELNLFTTSISKDKSKSNWVLSIKV